MTKVGRLIEEEKLEYGIEVAKKKEIEFARKLIRRGDDIRKMEDFFEILTVEDIEKIVREIEI